jgi:hypothetical protein
MVILASLAPNAQGQIDLAVMAPNRRELLAASRIMSVNK